LLCSHARAEPAELPRNGRSHELHRPTIDTLSERLSSAAAPRKEKQFSKMKLPIGRQRFSHACLCSVVFYFSFLLLPYRITLSAFVSVHCGIVRPICLAVLRLITNSNFVGCSTGMSAGLVPLRILSTKIAARRYKSESLAPYDIR